MIDMVIKQRSALIKARKHVGLAQHQLAKLMGKTQPWMSHVERGKHNPKRTDQVKMAKALKTDLKSIGFEE